MLVWFGLFALAYFILIPHPYWPWSVALALAATYGCAAVGTFRPQRRLRSALAATLLPPLIVMAGALGFFKILPTDLPGVLSHERLGYLVPSSPAEAGRALVFAAQQGDTEAVGRLLGQGAPPDLRGSRRRLTALAVAASLGHEDIARLLLEAGADPNTRHRQGTPAISLALSKGHESIALLLLEAGAEPDTPEPFPSSGGPAGKGPTPLYHAASAGALAATNALLWRGASPDGTPPHYYPLVAAARSGHTQIAAALLGAGADPNPQVPVRFHPVVWAVKANSARLLPLLLEAARPGLPRVVYELAYDLATQEGREPLVELLDEHS